MPAACKDLYLAERDSEAAKLRVREAAASTKTLAQKLLTCYSAMDNVERTHKLTYDSYSNRMMGITTQAYCETAIVDSESRKQRVKEGRHLIEGKYCHGCFLFTYACSCSST